MLAKNRPDVEILKVFGIDCTERHVPVVVC